MPSLPNSTNEKGGPSEKGNPEPSSSTKNSGPSGPSLLPRLPKSISGYFWPVPSNIYPDDIFGSAQYGHLTKIQRLVQAGKAKVTDRDEIGATALHWAAINDQVNICRYLLQQGADIDTPGGDLLGSPLQWAITKKRSNAVEFLVEQGANLHYKDKQGYHALHFTVHTKSVPILSFITGRLGDVKIDTLDKQGHTPLAWTVYHGDPASMEVLLQHGADVHVVDHDGWNLIHWAVIGGNRECIREMLKRGVEVTVNKVDQRIWGSKTIVEQLARRLKPSNMRAFLLALEDFRMSGDGKYAGVEEELRAANPSVQIDPQPVSAGAAAGVGVEAAGVPQVGGELPKYSAVADVLPRYEEVSKGPPPPI